MWRVCMETCAGSASATTSECQRSGKFAPELYRFCHGTASLPIDLGRGFNHSWISVSGFGESGVPVYTEIEIGAALARANGQTLAAIKQAALAALSRRLGARVATLASTRPRRTRTRRGTPTRTSRHFRKGR